jgi:hypothetical protein
MEEGRLLRAGLLASTVSPLSAICPDSAGLTFLSPASGADLTTLPLVRSWYPPASGRARPYHVSLGLPLLVSGLEGGSFWLTLG